MALGFLAAVNSRLLVLPSDIKYRCRTSIFSPIRIFLIGFLSVAVVPCGLAATIQSNGTGGGNWNAGTSWNGGVVPLATDDVIILSTDAINATTNQTCVNLRIDGVLNFNTNSISINVSGNLTFAGAGSTSGNNNSRSLNVTGNLFSLTGADGIVSGINLSVNGTTDLQGRIVFNNSTGSKTLTGDVTINNGGIIDFSAGSISIILVNNLIMSGTSSLAGTSGSLGTLIGVNSFTVNAGATATIGRVTMAIVGLTTINGTVIFNIASGTKTFVGSATINNNGAIEFTATTSVNFSNSIFINGTTSIGGASSATGNITVTNNFNLASGGNLTLGRVTLTVNGTSSIDGTITVSNTNGVKTLSNDVTLSGTGAILFTAAETLDIGNNLSSNPGSILGGGSAIGIINVGANYTSATGGTSTINNLTLNVVGNISAPGTSVIDTSGGTSIISVGGNWNITSSNPNAFIEGTSRIVFNGTAGTQNISTSEAGGETFYNLTINNTSATSPGLTTAVNLNARGITYTTGVLNLTGKTLTITGDGVATTDTYSAGTIMTSIGGANYIVADPSTNKSINYNGTQFGDATIGIPINVTSSGSTFNGSKFYGNALFTKTGSSTSDCNGGNIFYGPVSFTSITGADRWRMGNNTGDIFYDATFTHNGNSNFIIARSSLGNEFYGTTTISSSTAGGFYIGRNNNGANGSATFHGPVIVNITLTGNVLFAESSATFQHDHTFESTIQINSTASSTGDVSIGSAGFGSVTLTPTGQFIAGSLLGASTINLRRITQNGTGLVQTITAAGTSIINCGIAAGDGPTFNGNVNFSAPQVQLRFSTFNGTTNSFTQTGAVTNQTFGGNIFGSGSSNSFTNQGTGAWRLGNSAADDFNGDATFVRLGGAGALEPAYTNNSTFAGNISTTGTATAITFGNNGGRVTFDGATAKALSGSSSFSPIIARLSLNGIGSLTLNVPLSVTTNIDFTSGVLNSSSTNLLTMNSGSTVTGTPSNASHVDGPMRKIGNAGFTFPTGDAGIYRSIAITAPAIATDAFTAEYFKAAQAFGGSSTYDPSFTNLSACEYWILDRTTGTSNVSVTLSWNSADCLGAYIADLPSLRVARWNGVSWVNHGNGGTTGNAANGTVISSAVVTSFSPFTIASTSLTNPLPIELSEFIAVPVERAVNISWATQSELNNDFFTIERSEFGNEYEEIGLVQGAGTTNTKQSYRYMDQQPQEGISYYRLKQTDFDGRISFSHIAKVNRDNSKQLMTYPNPALQSTIITISYTGSFYLVNSIGQIISMVEDTDRLDTKGIPVGIYTLKSADGKYTRLVIE